MEMMLRWRAGNILPNESGFNSGGFGLGLMIGSPEVEIGLRNTIFPK